MKELRGHQGDATKGAVCFDPKRAAILLIGGDKNGNPKWYDEFVLLADRLFDKHLEELTLEEHNGK